MRIPSAHLLRPLRSLAVCTAALLCAPAARGADDYVWWEGEAATEHNFTNQGFPIGWFGDKAKGLSGGNWLNTKSKVGDQPVFARYQIDAPTAGTYNLLTRKFWKYGPFRWRFDDQAWQECGAESGLLDSYELATHISANWVGLGRVPLTKGAHRFEIELLAKPGEEIGACFDCFVLSIPTFAARGKLKPGEKSGLHAEGWWSFEPSPDLFRKEALLDLRRLNEAEAGMHGPLRAVGDDFVLGDGKPVRFWAANTGFDVLELDHAGIDYFAARLAKCGVNMLRLHGSVFERSHDDPMAVDEKQIDKYCYVVQAMKKQGIYTHMSVFFPLWMQVKPSDGIPGYETIANKHPFGLPYFHPRMQELYRTWTRKLLTHKSPYSGKTLAEDPAVGIFEIINEDSLFFWTFNETNVPAPLWAEMEQRYATWLGKRYGSLEQAFAAWGDAKHERDDRSAGRAGLKKPWDLTGEGLKNSSPNHRKRTIDQAGFYAETQAEFYAGMTAFVRGLGLKCPVSASNWVTADDSVLGGLERWSYLSAGVVDKHGYFGGKHEGEGSGYSLRTGHTFQDLAAVLDPDLPPIRYLQFTGAPHIHSEIAWNKPNRYMADNTLMVAAYGALQGVDGYSWFATASGSWNSHGGGKWQMMMPAVLGQFPAAALQYRRGDLKPGATVVRQVLSRDELFSLKGLGSGEGRNADFRANATPTAGDAGGLDPYAYFVGRVERHLTAAAPAGGKAPADPRAQPVSLDLAKYIDRGAKTITSSTGEIRWNYGAGLMTVQAPKARAATGFLAKAGEIVLGDISIRSGNEYGTIQVISLDDAPLTTSRSILIQAFSEEQMYGWKAENGVIRDLGQAPITVRELDATVTLPITGKATATVLDEHGYARGEAVSASRDGKLVVTLAKDALYTVIRR